VAGGTAFQIGTGYDFALARYMGVAPSQPIQAIIVNVQALVDSGVLNNGQGNSLLVKLQHSMQHLDDGLVKNAINDLQAFVNEVTDYITEDVFTVAQGQPLIDAATAEILLLQKK